jgi:serine O-acetyltransferase
MKLQQVSFWTKCYKYSLLRKFAYGVNKILGIDLPPEVKLGKNINFAHNSIGSVIPPKTVIGDDVIILSNVSIGKADIQVSWEESNVKGFIIEDGAALCTGARILCKEGTLIIGRKTIIAANAVLLNSTGQYEIWGGIPAKKIGYNEQGLAEDGLSIKDLKLEKIGND